MDQAHWAERLVRALLEVPLPRRLAHVQGVAARGARWPRCLVTMRAFSKPPHGSTTSATHLSLKTGFHPFDGARYLRDVHQADPRSAAWSAITRAPSSNRRTRPRRRSRARVPARRPDAERRSRLLRHGHDAERPRGISARPTSGDNAAVWTRKHRHAVHP